MVLILSLHLLCFIEHIFMTLNFFQNILMAKEQFQLYTMDCQKAKFMALKI